MRNFEQFLYRRKIKDTHAWLKSMGFTNNDELNSWCKSEGVTPPKEQYFQSAPPSKKVQKDIAKPNASGEDEAWHTPAAERSRKTVPRKKGRKASSTKRK